MKKLLLACFVLFTAPELIAQTKFVEFGAKAGINMASLRNRHGASNKNLVGFNAGGIAHINFSRDFALQGELVYSQQGTKAKTFTGSIPYEDHLNYLTVPILAQVQTKTGFRIYGGPQVGFLLNAETTQPGVDPERTNYYKPVDVEFAAGLSHLIKTIGLGFDARFNFSLTDIAKADNVDIRQTVWQVGVFYQFK